MKATVSNGQYSVRASGFNSMGMCRYGSLRLEYHMAKIGHVNFNGHISWALIQRERHRTSGFTAWTILRDEFESDLKQVG